MRRRLSYLENEKLSKFGKYGRVEEEMIDGVLMEYREMSELWKLLSI
jgi:hypothetical protein